MYFQCSDGEYEEEIREPGHFHSSYFKNGIPSTTSKEDRLLFLIETCTA
jgi:hypothetical protein